MTSRRQPPSACAPPRPPAKAPEEDADTIGDDDAPFEELSWEAVSMVDDLGAIREAKRLAAEHTDLTADHGERTTIASKDELNRLLAEVALKAKPHLVVHGEDGDTRLVALADTVLVGHDAECGVRLTGWKLFGRVAATLVHQTGAWNVVPEAPFWTPVYIGDEKLRRIRPLQDGDHITIAGLVLEYSKGDDR